MQHMNAPKVGSRLQAELALVDAKIAELQTERRVLLRLIGETQRTGTALEVAPRKNAIQRMVVEKAICDALSDGPPRSTGSIFQYLRIVHRNLNASTLRSYLHRMEARGALAKIGGRWALPAIGSTQEPNAD